MSYDDIEIEDMEWNEELKAFTYMCPCGDLFQITKVVITARCLLTTTFAPSHRLMHTLLHTGGASGGRGNSALSKLLAVHHCYL